MILRSTDEDKITDDLENSDYVDFPQVLNDDQSTESPRKQPLKTYSEIQDLLQQGKKRDIKHIIRDNAWPVNSTIRKDLWPLLCRQHLSQTDTKFIDSDRLYWDMVMQVFGTANLPDRPMMLPQLVEANHCFSYYLTHKGKTIVDRIVSILGFYSPDITFSPCIYSICSILLHYTNEIDCYNCIAALVAAKDKKFVTQTKLLYEVTWKTLMQIARKHVKSSTQYLTKFNSDIKLEKVFIDWIWWIFNGLPFAHLVRTMDCFLNEGVKVMYRIAMAILILFQKHTSNQNSKWPDEISKNGVEQALNNFIQHIPVTPSKMLKIAFGIRGLSSTYISRVFIKTEMVLKSHSVVSGSRQLIRSRSSDNFISSQSHANIQMNSHTISVKELFFIWSWLPVRITMYQPILLYTTEEHGCSLKTFFKRVQDHSQSLLIIKTFGNEVFGAYCSASWYERNLKDDKGKKQMYFGTGETFLFTLVPDRKKYSWIGIQSDKNCDHSCELFMAATNQMIAIGGGEGQGIYLDEDIRFGKTEFCKTFNNPPLCPSGDFQIRVLEVFGFVGS